MMLVDYTSNRLCVYPSYIPSNAVGNTQSHGFPGCGNSMNETPENLY